MKTTYDTATKRRHNETLTRLCKPGRRTKRALRSTQCLVLDGPEMLTTRELTLRLGVPPGNIVIPNHDAGDFRKIARRRTGARVVRGTWEQFLDRRCDEQQKTAFHLVNYDACCAANSPAAFEDVARLFREGHLADRCVLAVTLSARGGKLHAEDETHVTFRAFVQRLGGVAAEHGFLEAERNVEHYKDTSNMSRYVAVFKRMRRRR